MTKTNTNTRPTTCRRCGADWMHANDASERTDGRGSYWFECATCGAASETHER